VNSNESKIDRKADNAASKVRRTAEIRDHKKLNADEKNETASNDFEAHGELERAKHYKGRPDQT
jgi:hypothetical protein